jgi:hypothetical protein
MHPLHTFPPYHAKIHSNTGWAKSPSLSACWKQDIENALMATVSVGSGPHGLGCTLQSNVRRIRRVYGTCLTNYTSCRWTATFHSSCTILPSTPGCSEWFLPFGFSYQNSVFLLPPMRATRPAELASGLFCLLSASRTSFLFLIVRIYLRFVTCSYIMTWSWGSSVSIVTALRAGRPGFGSRHRV